MLVAGLWPKNTGSKKCSGNWPIGRNTPFSEQYYEQLIRDFADKLRRSFRVLSVLSLDVR